MAVMDQRLWRHPANLPDEFGRIWLVNLDKKPDGSGSWGITGSPMPVGWTDPLRMPPSYVDQPKGLAGRPDVNRVTVLTGMQKWFAIQQRHEADWKARAFQVAQRLFGTAAHEMIQKQDESLMLEVGPKPFPASHIIQAAIKGHKGFLGLEPLTKADREALGVENLEDLGFAPEPSVLESNPLAGNVPKAEKPLQFFAFVKRMKDEGVTDADEVKKFWTLYRADLAAQKAE